MRTWGKYLAFLLVFILAAFAFNTAQAQNGGEEHFPGGVVLKGEFLKFYRSVPERQLLFGNAISNELDMNGTRVQYFDRARFELRDNGKGVEVTLAPLGTIHIDASKTKPLEETFPSMTCRYFPKFGHRVCYSFLQFYDEHNGPVYFGGPITEMVYEGGQYVQYFENARFEYRYNMPSDMKVGLTNLGRLAMKKYYGPSKIPSVNSPIIQEKATDIQARAYVSHALVAPGAANTLFVVVRLSDYKAVTGAQVNASILIGDKLTRLPIVSTDSDGIAKIAIPAFDLAPKQVVQLQVTVNFKEQTVKTSTWYRIWY